MSERRLTAGERADLRIACRQHLSANLAKSQAHRTRPLAPTAKNHAIPVLEKSAAFVADGYSLRAALAKFHQRAGLGRRRPGLRAAAEQISRAKIAAIDGV